MDKCPHCDGTGYQSAMKQSGLPKDTPLIMQPIGVWICPHCHGSGKTPPMFEFGNEVVIDKALHRSVRVVHKGEHAMTTRTHDELKPCPFCGGDLLESQKGTKDREGIPENLVCCSCGATGPTVYVDYTGLYPREATIKAWNRRATNDTR